MIIDNNKIIKAFAKTHPNESITLSEEKVIIELDSIEIKGFAIVTLNFIPNADLLIKVILSGNKSQNLRLLDQFQAVKICFISKKKTIDVFIHKRYVDKENFLILHVLPYKLPLEIDFNKEIYTLDFCIFNLINFHANHFTIKDNNSTTSCSRLNIESEYLNVIIESHKKTHQYIETLKNEGGYAITHLGRINIKDKKIITNKQVHDLEEAIFNFFSFVRGNWTPILPIGIGKQNEVVWEQWGFGHISPWQDLEHWETWFDVWNGKDLIELLNNFLKYWAIPEWKETIRFAIYWYIHANTQLVGADGSIILMQTALERISWSYHVNDKQCINANKFKKFKASKKIGLLLSKAKISLKIPNELINLQDLSKTNNNISDGPSAFTNIRNSLVHPSKKKSTKTNKIFAYQRESYSLGIMYLELLLLYILNYKGKYYNRIKKANDENQNELVPWISNKENT